MELSIRKQMGGILVLGVLLCLFATTAIAQKGGGRLSPASLDLDVCGCPTTFEAPYCETWTEWSLEKTTMSGPFTDPDNEPFSFTVTVTEGETKSMLTAEGTIRIANSGEQTPTLANVAVLLEDLTPGNGNAPGPSGKNWTILAVTAENEYAACGNQAVTCYGEFDQTAGANLILYTCGGDPNNENDIIALSDHVEIPPAFDDDGDGKTGEDPALENLVNQNCWGIIDNDGDGYLDEDPIDFDGEGNPIDNDGDGLFNEDDPDDDGDGLTDEDDDCADVVEICFKATFPYPNPEDGDGIVPSEDDLRIDLLVTFKGGGKRGGTCKLDVNCDNDIDEDEKYVRTIQQRYQFDPPACNPVCQSVTLADLGAYSLDETCVDLASSTLKDANGTEVGPEVQISATGVEGTQTVFTIEGTVSCADDCPNPVQVPDLGGLAQTLESGTVSVTYPYGGGPAYFPHTYLDAGDFSGDYLSWCVDTDHTIAQNTVYNVNLYSSYEELPAGLIEYPENLDKVNWILNQGFVGTASTCGGAYTYGDVQRAIWALVENNQSTSGLGSWSQCRVDEILAAANASGEGFIPECGQFVGVIIAPVTGQQVIIAQVIMTQIPLACVYECPPCTATITNCATLTCAEDQSLVEGSPACTSFVVNCGGGNGGGIEPGDFCSQTQGGWGTDDCKGNNTACLRDAYFDDVFPNGLTVGTGTSSIHLTSSTAVAELLPTGGTPDCLHDEEGNAVGALTDPEVTSAGVFAGQLIAATLNVAFDAAGYGKCTLTGDCDFDPDHTLGELVYTCGPTAGFSVNEVIALANTAIGDCNPGDFTYSELSEALAKLNEEFVDCTTIATGCLVLPETGTAPLTPMPSLGKTGEPAVTPEVVIPDDYALAQNYPNPFNPSTTFSFDLPQDSKVKLTIYNMVGQEVATVVKGSFSAGRHTINWQAPSNMASGMYIYRLQAGRFVDTKKMLFLK